MTTIAGEAAWAALYTALERRSRDDIGGAQGLREGPWRPPSPRWLRPTLPAGVASTVSVEHRDIESPWAHLVGCYSLPTMAGAEPLPPQCRSDDGPRNIDRLFEAVRVAPGQLQSSVRVVVRRAAGEASELGEQFARWSRYHARLVGDGAPRFLATLELLEVAACFLAALGVDTELVWRPSGALLRVVGGRAHFLGRIAHAGATRLSGLELEWIPGVAGAYDVARHTLLLDSQDMLRLGVAGWPYLPTLLHELGHARAAVQLARGRALADQAFLKPEASTQALPSSGLNLYAGFQAAEEARRALADISYASRCFVRSSSVQARRDLVCQVELRAITGIEVAVRNVRAAKLARRALASGRLPVSFVQVRVLERELTTALLALRQGAHAYAMDLPLPQSLGPTDPNNAALLRDQLAWYEQNSRHQLALLVVCASALEHLRGRVSLDLLLGGLSRLIREHGQCGRGQAPLSRAAAWDELVRSLSA